MDHDGAISAKEEYPSQLRVVNVFHPVESYLLRRLLILASSSYVSESMIIEYALAQMFSLNDDELMLRFQLAGASRTNLTD